MRTDINLEMSQFIICKLYSAGSLMPQRLLGDEMSAGRTPRRQMNSCLLQTQPLLQTVWFYLYMFYMLRFNIRLHLLKGFTFSKINNTVLKTIDQIRPLHFADEKMRIQGGKLTFPQPHKQFVIDLGFKPRSCE